MPSIFQRNVRSGVVSQLTELPLLVGNLGSVSSMRLGSAAHPAKFVPFLLLKQLFKPYPHTVFGAFKSPVIKWGEFRAALIAELNSALKSLFLSAGEH